MPVPAEESGEVAIEQIVKEIGQLDEELGAKEEDVSFLKEFLADPVLGSLVKAHDALEGDESPTPASNEFISLVKDIVGDLEPHNADDQVAALNKIFEDAHFRALVEAHDDIANKNYEETLDALLPDDESTANAMGPTDTIRMVGIRKNPDEPLGITVMVENGQLVISRIMSGSTVDKLGLLHVGDVVKEVNGQEVTTPEGLMDVIKKTSGSITLKVIPNYVDQRPASQVFMKAHFNYDPSKDNLIANKASGLAFQTGDILQITNMEDKSWWQASKYGTDKTGLIPSRAVEEKRRAIISEPKNDQVKSSLLCGWARKKKGSYKVAKTANTQLDSGEVVTYEEVARLPAGVRRQALVLIGAQGIGRRSIKNKLIENEPEKYAGVVRCTSRAAREGEEDGKYYFFCDKAQMEADIKAGKYLEHGEYGGNFYGTKLDTVRDMLKTDKTSVLDVNTQAMKQLRTPEFMPYVVFIGAPNMDGLKKLHDDGKSRGVVTQDKMPGEKSKGKNVDKEFRRLFEESARIQRNFGHYFDVSVVNNDFDKTCQEIKNLCENLGKESTWVPAKWVTNLNVNV